jgi:hypothetical protein
MQPVDASLREQLAALPQQQRMNVVAGGLAIFDSSIERSGAVGSPPVAALYVTRRCNRSWPRRFAERRAADKPLGESLREHGFIEVRCVTRAEEGATYYSYPLVP